MNKPFSQACENNQEPIRQVLDPYLQCGGNLLEIGSGTGQHGAYISKFYPSLNWQPSDRKENLTGIQAWVRSVQRENFHPPIELDVNAPLKCNQKFDFVYSANTCHIMSWAEVRKFFDLIPLLLTPQGYFFVYGPFNYEGQFTSESNRHFDNLLKKQAPHRAIRDFEAVSQLATDSGLTFVQDTAMPANNRLIVWKLTR